MASEQRKGEHHMNGTDLKEQFRDAGCTPEEAEQLCAIARQGSNADLYRKLRMVRCRQLEQIHEQQRRLDRLDLLIRNTQKTG